VGKYLKAGITLEMLDKIAKRYAPIMKWLKKFGLQEVDYLIKY